jgi:transposase-like protein
MIHTTNAIEALNAKLRRARGLSGLFEPKKRDKPTLNQIPRRAAVSAPTAVSR